MEVLKNILDRAVIHFFASTSLVMIMTFALEYLKRKFADKKLWYVDVINPLLVAGIVVFAFSTMREAYDVSNGQPLVKAFTDYASWLLGCGFSVWGLYRFRK